MARKAKSSESTGSSKKIRPALTPEARELQMISLAVDLAENWVLPERSSKKSDWRKRTICCGQK